MQFAALQGQLPLGLIQEIGIEMLGAEEQPVAAISAGFRALLHEAAERRHAGARADHQDVAIGIGRHAEARVRFDVDRGDVAFGKCSQETAGRPQMRMPMRLVGDFVHGQMHFIAHALAAGGNGVQPWGERPQRSKQAGMVPIRRPAAQHVDHLMIGEQRRQAGSLGGASSACSSCAPARSA